MPDAPSTALAVAEPRPVGRPTLYRPEYCKSVVDFCREGYSLTAFAAEVGVSRTSLANWAKEFPDFAEACETAKAAACLFYEKALRDVASGDGGPGAATAAIFGVKNFGGNDFQDRRTVDHVGEVQHNHLSYDQALEEARRRGLPTRVFEE